MILFYKLSHNFGKTALLLVRLALLASTKSLVKSIDEFTRLINSRFVSVIYFSYYRKINLVVCMATGLLLARIH